MFTEFVCELEGSTSKLAELIRVAANEVALDVQRMPEIGVETLFIWDGWSNKAVKHFCSLLHTLALPSFPQSYFKNGQGRAELEDGLEGAQAAFVIIQNGKIQILGTTDVCELAGLRRSYEGLERGYRRVQQESDRLRTRITAAVA